MAKYPRIAADPIKLTENTQTVLSWCRNAGVDVTFVGKCIAEDSRLLPGILAAGIHSVGDSRLENLRLVGTGLPKMLLRIGMPDAAREIVTTSDVSLQSEIKTIRALDQAAGQTGCSHKVILMIDLGDLREGILYTDTKKILETAEAIHSAKNLELYGIGTNLTCYGSVIPDEKNLGDLCKIADLIRNHLHIPLPVVSGGNSSSLNLLRSGKMPQGINHLRIGEAILLGTDTCTGGKFPELHDDVFILEAELVEIQEKPSFPIGTRSVDAFGKTREYTDCGMMRRGILAVGRQDVPIEELIPVENQVQVIGGSSDHLIVDLGALPARVGDVLRFRLTYGALLGAYTSRYVGKCVVEGAFCP